MSENPGKKRKQRDGTSDPDASDHELSGPQSQVAGRKVKKKRKILNLNFMYMGSSDKENAVKNKPSTESQEEADGITADDAVSSHEPYREHSEKLKKSHKAKDSNRLHGDEGFTEEAAHCELTDPEGRSKKKKMKKDREERLLEHLAEESLTADIQHAARKKIKWQDGGGLQEDNESQRQDTFTEEFISQRNNPDGSETAEQVDVKKKKKKKRKDEPKLGADDITVDETSPVVFHQDHNEKLKKSHKSKYLWTLYGGEDLPEKTRPSVKKKPKKDREEPLLEHLGEESLTADIQHAARKKIKRQDGGGLQGDDNESHRQHNFTEELTSQRNNPDGSEAAEQVDVTKKKKKKRKDEPKLGADDITVDETSPVVLHQDHNEKLKKSHKSKYLWTLYGGEDLPEKTRPSVKKKAKKDREEPLLEHLAAESLTADIQHAARKKIKWQGGGGLQEDNESQRQDTFTEELLSQRNNPDGSETAEQVDVTKKKKKKRKDEPKLGADDITVDETSPVVLHQDHNEKLKKSHKSKYLQTLCGGEELPRPIAKKKPHKDLEECLLEEEESLTPDDQYTSKKKTKRKDGGEEQHRLNGFKEAPVTKRNCQDGSETTEQVSKSIDQAEDCLVEESLISETQHIRKKKKRQDDGDKHHRIHGFTGEPVPKRKYQDGSETREQVIDGTDQAGDCLVEESLISETQHISKKKKRKAGGGLQDDGFTEKLLSQLECPDASENLEQVDESVEQTEKPLKRKKKKRKDEPDQEAGGIAVDNASSSVGLHGDEASYRELTEAEDRPSRKKKKSKKDHRERPLEDVEEWLTPNVQHTSEKNKIKWKDGGGDGSRQQKHQGGAETGDQMDERIDQAEKPLKKKKKKRKDKPHQEADDLDNVSSSLGLCGAEPPYSKLTEIGDRSSRKKKKKSEGDRRQHPLEGILVEESLTSDSRHTNEEKTKWKDGGGENRRRDVFAVTKRKHEDGSESAEQIVDQAEVRVKKKAKKKKHLDMTEETSEILTGEAQLEDGETPEESTEVNQPSQSRAGESDGNVEGDAGEDTGQTSTRRSRSQTSAPPDADQNQDQRETFQKEGDNRPTTSDGNTEKAPRKRTTAIPFVREKDMALIKEYFPKLTPITLKKLIQRHEMERIRSAKQDGIMFRTGKFTIDEDEKIKENVQKFLSQVGIDSAELLFHTYKYPEMKSTVTNLKTKFHFNQRIGEGLFRPLHEVYFRGVRLYDSTTLRGRYSETEVLQLKKYCEIYGNNWPLIGTLMDRYFKSPQLKASQLRREVNTGKWSVEETNRLIAAVKESVVNALRKEKNTSEELVTVPKEMLYKGISWVKIEEKVETRNWTHCKIKWFGLIMMRMNNYINPFKGALGILNQIRMIRWFHDSHAKDYCDVKWDKLCDILGNVPNTIVQNRFVSLKIRIPGWKSMRLYEIVNNLYSDVLPMFEDQFAGAKETLIEPEKKKEFLIRDMFDEWSEVYEK